LLLGGKLPAAPAATPDVLRVSATELAGVDAEAAPAVDEPIPL